MSITREFISDCVARDDHESLRKLSLQKLDLDELTMQIPAILRDAQDIEAMCGLDSVDAPYTPERRETIKQLASFVTHRSALTCTTNLPIVNDPELADYLLRKTYPSKFNHALISISAIRAIKSGQHDVAVVVIDYLIEHKNMDALELYKMYEASLDTNGKNASPEIFDRLFHSGLIREVLRDAKRGAYQIAPQLLKDLQKKRLTCEDQLHEVLTHVMR